MRNSLFKWTLDTIESDPKRYGGDEGNPEIIKAYLMATSDDDKVSSLSNTTISNSVAVSRVKNKILVGRPDLDFRVKNLPKPSKSYREEAQTNITDYLGDIDSTIVAFLNADQIRWTYSPLQIIKEIKEGIRIEDIRYVLKNKELYKEDNNVPLMHKVINNISDNETEVKSTGTDSAVGIKS